MLLHAKLLIFPARPGSALDGSACPLLERASCDCMGGKTCRASEKHDSPTARPESLRCATRAPTHAGAAAMASAYLPSMSADLTRSAERPSSVQGRRSNARAKIEVRPHRAQIA